MFDTFSNDPKAQHQFGLLNIYRSNLRHYRNQAAAHGGTELAPPITRNGMNECITNIRRIRAILIGWGYNPELQDGEEDYV